MKVLPAVQKCFMNTTASSNPHILPKDGPHNSIKKKKKKKKILHKSKASRKSGRHLKSQPQSGESTKPNAGTDLVLTATETLRAEL